MNKILGTISLIFLFACGGNNSHSPSAVETQTTESSLRIAGTYTGMIPCADCDGIETDLKLNNDRTFELITVYRAKDTTAYPTKGTFRFGEDGNTLICEAENYVQRYKIDEGALIHLDQQGNVIEGALAEMYVLKKKR